VLTGLVWFQPFVEAVCVSFDGSLRFVGRRVPDGCAAAWTGTVCTEGVVAGRALVCRSG